MKGNVGKTHTTRKLFQINGLLSEDLKDDLFEVIDDLFYFSVTNYEVFLSERADAFMEKVDVSEDMSMGVYSQFLWWAIFCERLGNRQLTIFQLFLKTRTSQLRRKHIPKELIAGWQYITPGFYYISEIIGGRVFVLDDIFDMKEKRVGVYNEIYQLPKKGEMLTGLLIPFGDGTYTPVVDFFHVPEEAVRSIANSTIDYYQATCMTSNEDFFQQHYPTMFSIALKTMLQSDLF